MPDKEIVDDRAVTKQRKVLERAADAETRQMMRPVSQQVDAVEADLAGGRVIDPTDHVEDRRLAGAVRADEADDFVLPNVEGHSGKGLNAAKTLREVAQRKQGSRALSCEPPLASPVMLHVAERFSFSRLAQAEIELLDLRAAEQRRRGSVENHPSPLQNVAVVGNPQRKLRVLLDKQNSRSSGCGGARRSPQRSARRSLARGPATARPA